MKAMNAAGGWDGWIALNGSGYQTKVESNNTFSNWAWGGDVAGWILWSANLSCAQTVDNFCTGNLLQHRAPDCTVTTIMDCGVPGCSSATKQCVNFPPPAALSTLKATPTLVGSSGRTTLTWSIQNVTQCTVTGNDGNGTNSDSWTDTLATPGTITDSRQSGVLVATTKYTINCTGPSGTYTGSVTVHFAPKWKEN
jgi:hypothetical protein